MIYTPSSRLDGLKTIPCMYSGSNGQKSICGSTPPRLAARTYYGSGNFNGEHFCHSLQINQISKSFTNGWVIHRSEKNFKTDCSPSSECMHNLSLIHSLRGLRSETSSFKIIFTTVYNLTICKAVSFYDKYQTCWYFWSRMTNKSSCVVSKSMQACY